MDYTNFNFKLDNKIKECGFTRKYICKKLNLSYTAMARKMTNKNQFTANEIKTLMEVLSLKPDDVIDIFLS